MVRLRKEKNPFEASLVLNKDEIKIVEARYKGELLFFGVGTAKEQAKKIEGGAAVPVSARGAYQKETEYDWKLLMSRDKMPEFLPMDEIKEMAAAVTSLTSGSIAALHAEPKLLSEKEFERVEEVIQEERERRLKKYIDMVKKIVEEK